MTIRHHRKLRGLLCASTALIVGAGLGYAQEVDPTVADDPSSAERGLRLDTVEVTSLMREQGLQDVPISVQVVDGETLERFNVQTFDELDTSIPNLEINDTPGNNEIYVRGIGTQSGNLAFEQSVSMFVDGVYGGRARLFQVPFLDVERIEVLRGPQGALVGKNTSAGAIKIVSNQPTDQFEASVTGEYEFEFDTTTLTAVLSGPVSERLKARLAVKSSQDDGYTYNQTKGRMEPSNDLNAARFWAVYDASDNVTVSAKLDYAKAELSGTPFETGAIGAEADYVKESDDVLIPEHDDTESFVGQVNADIRLGEFMLQSITAYGDLDSENFVDADFTGVPMLAATFYDGYSQFSQELRLLSPSGQAFEYILGAMYLDQDVDIRRQSFFNFGPFSGNDERVFAQSSEVFSVYGQGTWNVTDTVRLIGSVRYTSEDKSATLDRSSVGVVPPSSFLTSLSGDRSEDQLDPAVTLQWDATDNVMLYATYAKGSKGGGFAGASSNAVASNFEFEPEEAETIELGAKTTLLDGRATFNAAFFSTDYTDLQVSQFNGVSFDFGNAASAKTEGMELEGALQIAEGVSLAGSLAYLDASYDSYPNGPCVAPDNVIPGCVGDISGARLQNAPEWSGNLNLDIERDLTSTLVWRGNVGVSYRSDYFTNATLFDDARQDAFAKVDLRLAIGNPDRNWEVALVGKNLTDEKTISQAFETPFSAPPGSTPDYTTVTKLADRPRTVAIQVTLRN
jgi:iron complex outermembrane receptor protein